MYKKMPTSETQEAWDAAYRLAVAGPPFFEEQRELNLKSSPSKEEAMILLARQMGRLAGMNDWALKNGIQTSFLGHLSDGGGSSTGNP